MPSSQQLLPTSIAAENYVFYEPNYDNEKGAANWAVESLNKHLKDKREFTYTRSVAEVLCSSFLLLVKARVAVLVLIKVILTHSSILQGGVGKGKDARQAVECSAGGCKVAGAASVKGCSSGVDNQRAS